MEPPVKDAADELLRTYTESGGINYLDAAANLPSRPAIESACVDLMGLMFPGFHGAALVDSSDLPDVTRSRIRGLHIRMKPEISKSFNNLEPAAADQKAEDVLNWFMSQLGGLRQVLWTDVDAAYEGDPAEPAGGHGDDAHVGLEPADVDRELQPRGGAAGLDAHVGATAVAFGVSERLKLERAPIAAPPAGSSR
jgi:serine O-acetyltransferase